MPCAVKNGRMATKLCLIVTSALTASAALASPAVAKEAGTVAGFAKAEAIIGGRSHLAAILAEQGALPRHIPLRPSGFALSQAITPSSAPAAPASPGAFSGKPDIFGSVALRVGRTPLDNKWQSVVQARVGGQAAVFARSMRPGSEHQRLEAINRYVNARVRFTDDSRQYRRADVWTSANTTLNRGRGDCEDYAIAKLQMLRVAGFSDRDLYLVILKDLVRRSDHAVAVVRSGERMLVLDNGTDRILESEAVKDYRPILTFAAGGAWTHGYKLREAPIELAAAARVPPPTPIPAAR